MSVPVCLWATHYFSRPSVNTKRLFQIHWSTGNSQVPALQKTSKVQLGQAGFTVRVLWFWLALWRLIWHSVYIVQKDLKVCFVYHEHSFQSNVWTVWLMEIFQNYLQTGKMSPKRVQWERWLSITGTNMSKCQNHTASAKMSEKRTFLQHATPWSVSFSVFFFSSITHGRLTNETFRTCLQGIKIWTLTHLHCANV